MSEQGERTDVPVSEQGGRTDGTVSEQAERTDVPVSEQGGRTDVPTTGAADVALPFRVEVVRSKRRTKSYAGRLADGVLRVTVPSWMGAGDEQRAVEEMTARFRRKFSTARIDLRRRMLHLHRTYGLPAAREIRWTDEMSTRWASCTPATSTIRMSSRLAGFPDWVVDYVLVHEMAHLRHAGHDAAFWQAVGVYPKAERAIGFLIAKSGDDGGLD